MPNQYPTPTNQNFHQVRSPLQ